MVKPHSLEKSSPCSKALHLNWEPPSETTCIGVPNRENVFFISLITSGQKGLARLALASSGCCGVRPPGGVLPYLPAIYVCAAPKGMAFELFWSEKGTDRFGLK